MFRVAGAVAVAPSFVAGYYGAFHYDYTTTVTSAIDVNQTTIPVVSTTGFSTAGAIVIDYEIIIYTGITATSFTGCTRGAYSTSKATHVIGSYVGGAQGTTAATSTLLQLNTTDFTSGVTLSASSEMVFAHAGVYNIQFSAQITNAGNAPDNFTIWLKKNGTDLDSTGSIATTPSVHSGIPGAGIIAANFYINVLVGDKIQFYWLTDSGNTVITTYPQSLSPVHPASPAMVATVNQIA